MIDCVKTDSSGAAIQVKLKTAKYRTVISDVAAYGYSSESLARSVVSQLRHFVVNDCPIERHLADQILLPLFLGAGGKFRVGRISEHFLSGMETIKAFTGQTIKFEKNGKGYLVEVPQHKDEK